jgi:hypothetical protein
MHRDATIDLFVLAIPLAAGRQTPLCITMKASLNDVETFGRTDVDPFGTASCRLRAAAIRG